LVYSFRCFFFSSRRRHTRFSRDWSSDVCSSDLFVLKTPPTPVLLREAAGIDKASTAPGREQVGTVTEAQIEEIAKIKMPDLNAYDLESAKAQVIGTARSMGITVAS